MKTIVVAAQKGGAGKTTLARNLAVAATQDGRTVLCLDLDPQGSLRAWWEGREADAPAMLDRDPAPHALRATLNAAQAQFELCIIDTPPAAPEWLADALGAADLVLIPVRPSPDDLRAVGATIAAVNAEQSVILPLGWYRLGRVVEIYVDSAVRIRLGKLIDAGQDFERITYELA